MSYSTTIGWNWSHPTTLGFGAIASSYSWLKATMCKNSIQLLLAEDKYIQTMYPVVLGWKHHIQLLLAEIMHLTSLGWSYFIQLLLAERNFVQIQYPTTLGWNYYANNVSIYSWTKHHIQLLLAEIIALNYSWLKLLHLATLGWKQICANTVSIHSLLKTNILKPCTQMFFENIIFSYSWLKLTHQTTLG